MRYYVYIVECSDSSYYTGVTNDFERRLYEHKIGLNKRVYTYNRRPVKLVFVTEFLDVEQAIEFEKKIKGWSRKKKEALIEKRWNDLPALSMNTEKKMSILRQAQDDVK